MKLVRSLLPVLVAVMIASTPLMAQEKQQASPPGEASVKFADGKTVAIKYSRPSMRGRKIFGELVPYDKVWRTGANAATSLTTDTALDISGTTVPAGNYTLTQCRARSRGNSLSTSKPASGAPTMTKGRTWRASP